MSETSIKEHDEALDLLTDWHPGITMTKDLGIENSWSEQPPELKACHKLKHDISIKGGDTVDEYECKECKIKWRAYHG